MTPIDKNVLALARELKAPQAAMNTAPKKLWAACQEAQEADSRLALKFIGFENETADQYLNLVIGRRVFDLEAEDQFVFGWLSGPDGACYREIEASELQNAVSQTVAEIKKGRLAVIVHTTAMGWMPLFGAAGIALGITVALRLRAIGGLDAWTILLSLAVSVGICGGSWLVAKARAKSLWQKDPLSIPIAGLENAYQYA